MKAVGEVMAIGKTYKETLQKAIRGLENGRSGLGFAKDFNKKSKEELLEMMKTASSERHFQMYEALRKGATDELPTKKSSPPPTKRPTSCSRCANSWNSKKKCSRLRRRRNAQDSGPPACR